MREPPDLPTLAKRYVELWQDYLTAAAADPDLADSLACLLAGAGAAAAISPWQAWLRSAAMPRDQPAPHADDGAASARATAAAAPSHERDDGLAEFARSLARLDERLAALEAGKQSADRAAAHGEARDDRP